MLSIFKEIISELSIQCKKLEKELFSKLSSSSTWNLVLSPCHHLNRYHHHLPNCFSPISTWHPRFCPFQIPLPLTLSHTKAQHLSLGPQQQTSSTLAQGEANLQSQEGFWKCKLDYVTATETIQWCPIACILKSTFLFKISLQRLWTRTCE